MRRLSSLSRKALTGKRVLVRIDINSPLKNGRPVMNPRIKATAQTILFLKRYGARVVLMAHQGQRGRIDFISLRHHAKLLNRYVSVSFAGGITDSKTIEKIGKMRQWKALLLENIRFSRDEDNPLKKSNELVRKLSPLFDLYVNDAFSVSHRNVTSIVSFPRVIPSCMGLTFEKEIKHLGDLKRKKNMLYILGGNKTEDLLPIVARKKGKILSGGTLALFGILASGKRLGKQEKILKKKEILVEQIKRHLRRIVLPLDLAYVSRGRRKEILIEDLPVNALLLDIGKKTVAMYVSEIMKAKTIFMKGTMGKTNDSRFLYGTRKIDKALARTRAKVIAGGGHSATFLNEWGIRLKKTDHVSLSGGALITYISGKKLPGLVSLERGMK